MRRWNFKNNEAFCFFSCATAEDKRRFPREYEAFKRSGELAQEGTPLAQWTYSTPAFVRDLNYSNVFTVEQLAQLSDQQSMQLGMGMLEKRDLAQAWLAKANGDEARVARIADENADLRAKLDAQAAEMAAMRQMLEQATRPQEPPAAGGEGKRAKG